jgi:dihydropyrimidine dehydrogenase (NADP+)
VVDFELNLVKDLGVEVVNGRTLTTEDLTIENLKKDGYNAIFLGFGHPEPKVIPMFENLDASHGFHTSKDFLPKVAKASKPGKSLDTLDSF